MGILRLCLHLRRSVAKVVAKAFARAVAKVVAKAIAGWDCCIRVPAWIFVASVPFTVGSRCCICVCVCIPSFSGFLRSHGIAGLFVSELTIASWLAPCLVSLFDVLPV